MNCYGREIMQKFLCDEELASEVYEEMCCDGIDFSECEQREFDICAKECYDRVIERRKS